MKMNFTRPRNRRIQKVRGAVVLGAILGVFLLAPAVQARTNEAEISSTTRVVDSFNTTVYTERAKLRGRAAFLVTDIEISGDGASRIQLEIHCDSRIQCRKLVRPGKRERYRRVRRPQSVIFKNVNWVIRVGQSFTIWIRQAGYLGVFRSYKISSTALKVRREGCMRRWLHPIRCPKGISPFSSDLGYASYRVLDLNGDGYGDIVRLTPRGFTEFIATGDGGFRRTLENSRIVEFPLAQLRSNSFLDHGDVNGDGRDDLLSVTKNGITTLLVDQYGRFHVTNPRGQPWTPEPAYFTNGYRFSQTGDFNGDGRTDLVVIKNEGLDTLLSNGDGTFAFAQRQWNPAPGFFTSSNSVYERPRERETGDINGDGATDLIVNTSNSIHSLISNRDGTFRLSSQTLRTNANYDYINVGDFNADGKADVEVTSLGGDSDENLWYMETYFGTGDGLFAFPGIVWTPFESGLPNVVPSSWELTPINVVGDARDELVSIPPGGIYQGYYLLESRGDGRYARVAVPRPQH